MNGTQHDQENPVELPPLPGKDASFEEWHNYNRALFEAGKLNPPEPAK